MTFEEWYGSLLPFERKCLTREEAFQAGAASRDAEIAGLQHIIDEEAKDSAQVIIERDQPRAELAAAIAACKVKDEALLTCQTGDYSTGHVIHPSFDESLVESAIAIQPDDAALKTWLGEPAWFCRKDANGVNVFYEDIEERPAGCTPLYSPKGLK